MADLEDTALMKQAHHKRTHGARFAMSVPRGVRLQGEKVETAGAMGRGV